MDKLINLQSALDAFDLRDDAFLSVAVIKAKLTELPSAQSEKAQLSTEGTTNLQPTCNKLATDTVSRQAAIDVIDYLLQHNDDAKRSGHSQVFINGMEDGYYRVRSDILFLPSAQPETDCVLKEFGNCSYSETGCSDCKVKAKIRNALSAQPNYSDEVKFWKERAEFYGEKCIDLLNEINKGVKINSIEVNENGIIFTKEQKRSCDGCKHLGMWENEIEYGYPCPCLKCVRRASDNYER